MDALRDHLPHDGDVARRTRRRRAAAGRAAAAPSKASSSAASAMRQTSRIASSLPASGSGPQRGEALEAAGVARAAARRPRPCRRCRSPVPSQARPRTGPSSPCSAIALATWAWWCCTPTFTGSAARERVARREVVRVQVVGDHLGPDAEEALQPLDLLLERAAGLEVVEVADVRPEPGLVARGEAERVLEVGAAGEHRPRDRPAQRHRPRDVAARAAEDHRPPRDHARHRVVAAVLDLAVVGEEEVGDAAEPLERLVVARRHRLLREVARGHDERAARPRRAAGGAAACRRAGGRRAGCRARPRRRGRLPRAGAHEHDRPLDARPAARSSRGVDERQRARASSTDRTITANGFSSRFLRSRRRRTAPREVASHARW